jgi:beta-lactamase class A
MSLRLAPLLLLVCLACATTRNMTLDYDTKTDAELQMKLESIDATIRERYGMTADQTDVGLIDLERGRIAMIHPDKIEYAASVAKVGILYAYFKLHGNEPLDTQTRHELGLMIKVSSNEMAAKYSRQIGLKQIQEILNADGFYDASRGGGIWVGKHYGVGTERYGDPIANHSHGVTVRQLLRFYLLLEERKLISPQASKTMREIFESPDIPHDDVKFVKGLEGRRVHIIRKLGTWENWLHDSEVVTGRGRHYILVGLTTHPKGDDYLTDLARSVDDLMGGRTSREARPSPSPALPSVSSEAASRRD